MSEIRKLLIDRLYRGNDPFKDFPDNLFQKDVSGWGGSEHPFLTQSARLTRAPLIVEVGVWKGASVISMAKAMREANSDGVIIAVDTWLGSSEHWLSDEYFYDLRFTMGYPSLQKVFMSNILAEGVENYVLPFPIDSLNAADLFINMGLEIDVLHLDAAHNYESVTMDLRAWWPVIKPGGWLVGDDYDPYWPGVVRAFDDFRTTQPACGFELQNSKCRLVKVANQDPDS